MDDKQTEKMSCPYIGLRHDRATYSNFPSTDNVCYHAQPINAPAFSHQHEYCLSIKFTECSVYASHKGQKLPDELQQTVEKKTGKKWMRIIFGICIILGFAIFFGLYWNNKKFTSGTLLTSPTQSQTVEPTNVIFMNTATAIRTIKPTQTTPSLTSSPQATATLITSTPSSTPTEVRSFGL